MLDGIHRLGKDDLEYWCDFCRTLFKYLTIDRISSWPGDLFVSNLQSSLKMPSVENNISGIDGYEDSVVGMSVRFSFVA